ncbi:MAG: DUF1937 family protein [Candidatus Zixiibacteriota bacterium]
MIYIASPYWDNDEAVRDARRAIAIKYSERLAKFGILNYSPLGYSSQHYKNVPEKYWIAHGLKMIDACTEVHVMCLDGWDKSEGVIGEIEKAKQLNIPIKYIRNHERLAFCGSRSLKCKKTKQLILDEIKAHQAITVVTHGEPDGVCRSAIEVARRHGLSLSLHHLKIKEKARGAFEHRTKAVLADCDYCIFLHDGKSKGTKNELELARKMNIPYTYYVFQNGEYIRQVEVDNSTNPTIAGLDSDFDDLLQSIDLDLDLDIGNAT